MDVIKEFLARMASTKVTHIVHQCKNKQKFKFLEDQEILYSLTYLILFLHFLSLREGKESTSALSYKADLQLVAQ